MKSMKAIANRATLRPAEGRTANHPLGFEIPKGPARCWGTTPHGAVRLATSR